MSSVCPPADTALRARRSPRWGLFVLLVSGTLLRLVGIGYLLPSESCPDGEVLETEVRLLHSSQPEFHRGHGAGLYPQLLPRIAAAVIPRDREVAQGTSLDDHLEAATFLVRRLRIVLALLSMLIVPATWYVARRFLSPGWSLAAAAFMCFSFLDLWFAQQERPHAAAAAFGLWAVVCALHLRRRPDVPAYIAMGVAMGLSVGSVQSGLAVLPAFFAAVLLRRRTPRPTSALWAIVSLAILAALIWFFYPFVFHPQLDGPPRALGAVGSDINLSGHNLRLGAFNGAGFAKVFAAVRDYDPLIGVLAFVGLSAWLVHRWRSRSAALPVPSIDRERRADLLVVLAHALPYLLAIGMYQLTCQRFVIPLLPYAACLAVYGLSALAAWISTWRAPVLARRAAVVALVAIPLGTQAWAACKLAAIRAAPDTITLAARWIAEHLQPGADRILVQPALDLPLFQTEDARAANVKMLQAGVFEWFAYQRTVPAARRPKEQYDLLTIGESRAEVASSLAADTGSYLRELHGDYAVVEVYEGWGWKPLRELRAELQHSAVLVARFSPDDAARWHDLPILHQDDAFRRRISWFARVLGARCTGPIVEIYRLPK